MRETFKAKYQKEELKPKIEKPKEGMSMMKAFDEFVKDNGVQNDWTHSTYEKFAAVKNHLLAFDKKLTFESFTESKLTDYVNYLRDVRNMRNSTISKQMGFLKWFLRWSTRKG